MIAKNIQKFNHRPYHVPAPIKEYLRVRDKQHGKDPKLPHPIKKRKHRDMCNMEVQDEIVEKDIWDEPYEDTEGSQQPHLDPLTSRQKPYEHRKCTTAFCIAQKIDRTHNTPDCYNKDKDPNTARAPRYPRGKAPLSTRLNSSPALLMTQKGQGKGQHRHSKGKTSNDKGKGRGRGPKGSLVFALSVN